MSHAKAFDDGYYHQLVSHELLEDDPYSNLFLGANDYPVTGNEINNVFKLAYGQEIEAYKKSFPPPERKCYNCGAPDQVIGSKCYYCKERVSEP